MHATKEMVPCPSFITYCLKSEVSMLDPLHSITNQELFKKHPSNPCIPHQRNGHAPVTSIII